MRRVAGTSAGAITATLLASGADASALHDSVLHTEFARFVDHSVGILGDAARMLRHYGLYDGRAFVDILRERIGALCGDPDVTFGELRERARREPWKYRELSVVAANLTRQRPEVFSAG